MIVDSQGGSTLTFTRVALGDGVLAQGQDQSALTAIISEKLSANISSYTDNEDGTFSLVFSVNNSTLDVGFMHREIGIMAKVDDGEEQLYAYTNAGTAATFLYDKTTPIQERVVRIDFVVGSAENLSVEIDGSVVYPTRGEVQQMIGAHNTGSDSHADLLHLRKPSTVYAVGDIAYSPQLPSWARLECVKAGTTNTGDLPITSVSAGGVLLSDGSVLWIIDDVRDCTPVGAVRGSLYLPSGYVLADGATVDRADYPRLVRLADTHNLWTNDTTANAGLFGVGDGSTTMVLPNWIDRMEQMASTAGSSVAAGLPNIEGQISSGTTGFGPDLFTGAFTAGDNVSVYFLNSSRAGGVKAKLDASLSNPIYGASNTVQPPAIKQIPILRY